MIYRELTPPPVLSPFLECVWILEGRGPSGGAPESVSPDGCPEVVIHLEDRFRRLDVGSQPVTQSQAVLVGPLTRPLTLEAPARIRTVGLRFRPGGVAVLARGAVSEMLDREVPLDVFAGDAAPRIAERLAGARDTRDLIAAVVDFFVEVGGTARPLDPAVQAAVALILRRRGAVALDRVASYCGLQPRSLQRRFDKTVGLSPKRLARIVRFQRVLRALATSPEAWVAIALRCGYFDQAHLVRDFRELSGGSPSAYLRGQGDLSRYFTAPDRLARFFAA